MPGPYIEVTPDLSGYNMTSDLADVPALRQLTEAQPK